MTSCFFLFLLTPAIRHCGNLWPEGRILVPVLFGGCDTSLVDPGGSFMCVADNGMLHKLLIDPKLDRTKL